MLTALFVVQWPIIHPLPAAAGDVIGWYPAQDVVVMRRRHGRVFIVRRLGFANDGAIGSQHADGAIASFSSQDEALLRRLIPALLPAGSDASPSQRAADPG